jgi:type II secretory pathway predicted ATPase ExeA
MVPGYESVFGLVERPFSLAPDPRFFFRGGGHGRALDAILAGLARGDSFLLVTGDLGVGKTLLGRTLAADLRGRRPVACVGNPLVTPDALLRLLGDDFAAVLGDSPPAGYGTFVDAHQQLSSRLAMEEPGRHAALQVVLLAQPPAQAPLTLGSGLDDRITTRARLTPLNREECADYVAHRLRLAGASGASIVASRAVDMLFGLSNGLPRLVNLLCERALQEAAANGQQTIEPGQIAAAASALKLTHARPRRFRWFSRKVS